MPLFVVFRMTVGREEPVVVRTAHSPHTAIDLGDWISETGSRRLDLGDGRYLAAVLLAARARLAGAFLAGDFFAAAGLALADRLAFTAGALAFVAFLAPLAAGLALSDRVDLAAVGFADFLAGFALALGDRLVVALAAPFAPLTLRLLAFFAAAFLVAAILWLLML